MVQALLPRMMLKVSGPCSNISTARIMTAAIELLRLSSPRGGFELPREGRGCRPLTPGLGAGSRKPAH